MKRSRIWESVIRNIALQLIIILAFTRCSYFRQSFNNQYINLIHNHISHKATNDFLHLNKTVYGSLSQTLSTSLITSIGFQLKEMNLTLEIIGAVVLILIISALWWIFYVTRIKKKYAELDLRNNIINNLKEELEGAKGKIRNLKAELNNAEALAKQSDNLKNAFISNMSHEIRTPMNAIVGLTSFLNDPKLSKVEVDEYIETINSSCKQLLTVIDDIVDISRIESGQMTITPARVNLDSLIQDIYLTYKNLGELKKINFTFSTALTDNHSQIFTDRSRLKQVLIQLLNNAFRFTENGNIEFGYFPVDENITFYVKDSGIGISPKNQSTIFNRFWHPESSLSRSYVGLGLGLSISKSIVEKMGGKIWVESEPGTGSVFYFSLPIKDKN